MLQSTGSQIALSDGSNGIPATTITIYEADANGNQIGAGNTWTYTGPNSSPQTIPCETPVTKLDFTQGAVGWPAASRHNGPSPDSIGVAITYTYVWQTPLDGIIRVMSAVAPVPRFLMTDRTVMALEPTK